MAAQIFKKPASLRGKTTAFAQQISRLWFALGDKLQDMRQNKKNRDTYTLLLENDDYLLRDIGVTRNGIQILRAKIGRVDAGCELEKIRAASGRNLP